MKGIVSVFIVLCMLVGLTACNQDSKVNQVLENQVSSTEVFPDPTLSSDVLLQSQPTQPTEGVVLSNTEGIDVDLSILSSTMIYAEVYDMVYNPESYYGKVIRIQGTCAMYADPNTGTVYYACIIQDATACCSQGLEFTLVNEDEYPDQGAEITVTGTFETYEEDGYRYIRLANSVLTY